MRNGKARVPRDIKRTFRAGKPVTNQFPAGRTPSFGSGKKVRPIKVSKGVYAVERKFSSVNAMRTHIRALRDLRQYCKAKKFSTIEFTPSFVQSVDTTTHRTLEQVFFAPNLNQIINNFRTIQDVSPYGKLFLRKIKKHGLTNAQLTTKLLQVMLEISDLSSELNRRRITINMGEEFDNVLVLDYNPSTKKFVVAIAGHHA